MTALEGYARPNGKAGARNHVFVMPSVVCSVLVAQEIAKAAGATSVSHQHGCGHIGADIVQTRQLFVGLAANPNVAHSLVVSLGCETVQGKVIADELDRLGYAPRFVSIQKSGGSAGAREAGVREARELRASADRIGRRTVDVGDLTLGVVVSRSDERIAELIAYALKQGARVVVAANRPLPAGLGEHAVIDIGDEPTAPLSVIRNPGAGGAQLLAAAASCRSQILVEFAASEQPPLGFPLAPVMSVAAPDGLHRLIEDEFDAAGAARTVELWDRVGQIYSGAESKSEVRDPTIFAIPRLMRTM
jgi:hypothetical protein